jgi:hypothetical protein
MNRRSALRMLGALGATLIAARVPSSLSAAAACPAWVDDELLAGIRSIGKEYLAASSDQRGIDRIWSLVASDDRTALQQMISGDFAHQRLVRVADWWLSRTEGRIYAAIAAHC